MAATGSIGVEHQAPRPHIVADLKVSGFNLGAFTGESGGASVAPEVQTQPAAPAPSGPAEPPGSIEELLNRPGPQVKGFTQRSGWSQEPIELAALGWIDADARIAVSDTKLGQLHVDAPGQLIGVLLDHDVRLDALFLHVHAFRRPHADARHAERRAVDQPQ